MNDASILLALKNNLDIIPTDTTRDDYLKQLIAAAKAMIKREGVTLRGSMEDGQLIVMYAAYMYRKRADSEQTMPRMLRWALNNRVFVEKMGG